MMQHRPVSHLSPESYPPDPWRLIERGFHPDRTAVSETLFALANGYLGVRGSLEEGEPAHEPGTFINGLYETWPINYPEEAFGLPRSGQSIVVLPDATPIIVHVEDQPLRLSSGRLLSHERVLDMREGLLRRQLEWESPGGTRVRIRTERLVSLVERNLAAFRFELKVLAGGGPLAIVSRLAHPHALARPPRRPEPEDPREARRLGEALVPEFSEAAGQRLLHGFRTGRSGMHAVCGVDHRLRADGPIEVRAGDDGASVEYAAEVGPGSTVRIDKFAVYGAAEETGSAGLRDHVAAGLARAAAHGFDRLREQQRESMGRFWERADVLVEGDAAVQQAVRWNLFQLAQATLRTDGLGVPAKGLTGRGYDGHYFWDVDVYVQPFLTYVLPEVSRRLIAFRHRMLGAARRQARVVDGQGALFPWRTINGEEASGHYPTSTAQYHINADVVHALRQYLQVAGEREVLSQYGVEVLVETARFWASVGFYGRDGRFHIHRVTGPDEYTPLVDDNLYTNVMARENLRFARDAVEELRKERPQRYQELAEQLGLRDGEPDQWTQAAECMAIPYDQERGVHPQDASFFSQEVWDFAHTPPDHYPLLLHYHPLVLARYQVVKQADVVLAMLLAGNRFTPEQRRANFLYYEAITTGDSSLSHAIQSVVAAELEMAELAMTHFHHTLFMDLTNWAGNADDGVHVASSGGVWLALVYGFAGMRDYEGRITFDPHIPDAWTRLAFTLSVRGQTFAVDLSKEALTFQLRQGDGLDISVRGQSVRIDPGRPVSVRL